MMRGRPIQPPRGGPPGHHGSVKPPSGATNTGKHNFDLKLSSASSEDGVAKAPSKRAFFVDAPAKLQEVSPEDTAKLLARVPADKEEDGDARAPFLKREASKPTPKSGETLEAPFPPPTVAQKELTVDLEAVQKAALENAGPLAVVRYSPEPKSAISATLSAVSVTFNHPMVALSSVDDLEAAKQVVRIEPQPAGGQWRWLGTQTVQFTMADGAHLPRSTHYTVRVRAGTKSQLGAALEKEFSFSFSLSTLRLVSHSVSDESLEPSVLLCFDQRVDPQVIAQSLKPAAVVCEPYLKRHSGLPGQFVFVKFKEALKANTRVTLTLPKGSKGTEGPLGTEADQSVAWDTYKPFVVRQTSPNPPHNQWYNCNITLMFNNVIDKSTVRKELISVSPSLGEEWRVRLAGPKQLLLVRAENADLEANTKYTVKLSKEFKDEYGQSLSTTEVTADVGEKRVNQYPRLSGDGIFTILDPGVRPHNWSVEVAVYEQLRVRFFHVDEKEFAASANVNLRQRYLEPEQHLKSKVFDKVMQVVHEPGKQSTVVSLLVGDLLQSKNEAGFLFAAVEPTEEAWKSAHAEQFKKQRRPQTYEQHRPAVHSFVLASRYTVDAISSHGEHPVLTAWVTDLATGAPVPGAEVFMLPGAPAPAKTDANGLTSFKPIGERYRGAVGARIRGELAVCPNVRLQPQGVNKAHLWFTMDDRKLYKPKETVRAKGYLRTSEVRFLKQGTEVTWAVTDSRNAKLGEGSCKLSAHSAFDLSFALPDTANLGTARISFTCDNQRHTHQFEIQEFRRPEFQVACSHRSEQSPLIATRTSGGVAVASSSASYFSGGDLSGARHEWAVTADSVSYSPPGWTGYTFGEFKPFWRYGGHHGGSHNNLRLGQWSFEDAPELKMQFSGNVTEAATAITLKAAVTVHDTNNQAISSSTVLTLHPSSVYIGFKSQRYYGKEQEEFPFDVVVVNPEGDLQGGLAFSLSASRTYQELVEDATTGISELETRTEDYPVVKGVSGRDKATRIAWTPPAGGNYKLVFSVTDSQARVHSSTTNLNVQGTNPTAGKLTINKRIPMDTLTLIPSQKEYEVGDTAELLVQLPFSGAHGLVRVGDVNVPFHAEGDTASVSFPITEEHVPKVIAYVYVAGACPRPNNYGAPDPSGLTRPAYGQAEATLEVTRRCKSLSVAASSDDPFYTPGSEAAVYVTVVDELTQQPVANADVTLIVIDEAVLALTGYTLRDPVAAIYDGRHLRRSQATLSRQNVILITTDDLEEIAATGVQAEMSMAHADGAMAGAPMMMKSMARGRMARAAPGGPPPGGGAPAPAPIGLRSNFEALANWSPSVMTDKGGIARVSFKLPDSLTKYRIYAVAGTERKFGLAESSLIVKLPLQVRPSPPRFLNFGDSCTVQAVVVNQSSEAQDVLVAARTNSTLRLTGVAGVRVHVGAGKRETVSFAVETLSAGTASMQIVASGSGAATDAAKVTFPVYTPATSEAFATYGSIAGGDKVALQTLSKPTDVIPQFGSLDIALSSTAVQALTDAVLYLEHYEYSCVEQLSSRLIGILSLKDVLAAFGKDAPHPERLTGVVVTLIKRQLANGGFGWWGSNSRVNPYLTVHALHALVVARDAGVPVDIGALKRTQGIVKNIEAHFEDYVSKQQRNAILAYSFAVLHKAGDDVSKRASALFKADSEELTPETLGWLLQANVPEAPAILKNLLGKAAETAETASFVSSYGDNGMYVLLHSTARSDAVILDGMLQRFPDQLDLPIKVAKGLLAHKVKGAWRNTQENCFALLALHRYFKVVEADEPAYTAGVWLGDVFGGEHAFKGRSTQTVLTRVPMAQVLEGPEKNHIVLEKKGTGRLYYRFGLRYAPADLNLVARNYGFQVSRVYEGVDEATDVTQAADGSYTFKEGKRVRVTITMVTTQRRYHVALVDQLPGGLEIINKALKGAQEDETEAPQLLPSRRLIRCYRPHSWYSHQNLRDERAEAFTSLLWEGQYKYSYVARATTKGDFVVPPAKAEEMYSPEIFGRSATQRVSIIK